MGGPPGKPPGGGGGFFGTGIAVPKMAARRTIVVSWRFWTNRRSHR